MLCGEDVQLEIVIKTIKYMIEIGDDQKTIEGGNNRICAIEEIKESQLICDSVYQVDLQAEQREENYGVWLAIVSSCLVIIILALVIRKIRVSSNFQWQKNK